MKSCQKKKLTPIPKLIKKSQTVFNAWVRNRDAESGCVSCGGSVDHAGHYFNVGQFNGLRFTPENCHGQCVKCNLFLSGNLIRYRQGLIARYGEQYVTDLEAMGDGPRPYKWTRTELDEIIQKFTIKKK